MIGALIIGSMLAVGALAFVLYPVFFAVPRRPVAAPLPRGNERDTAVDALREIEFDRATGKLSDDDYAELKTRYTGQAIVAMRRQEAAGTEPIMDVSGPPAADAPSDDELEAVVRAFRKEQRGCPTCGPRPEPDALFCSNCGRYLHDRCAGCGAPVVAPDARFCINCGSRLAA